ncbi:MAG: DUF4178 domain-containing protein [Chloroflexota bacterium]
MADSKSCPACGAPLDIKNRFVKVATCDFCGQTLLIKDTGVDPTGKKAKLVDLPSKLFIDAEGNINGEPFQVLGRLRYQYDSGMWDEWFIIFNNEKPGWLVEDEGTFKLYHKTTLTSSIPSFDQVRVGGNINVGGRQVFVTEKGEANIAGGEGQLAFNILPGEEIRYIDGNSGDEQVSIEFTTSGIELLTGQAIDPSTIEVTEEDW